MSDRQSTCRWVQRAPGRGRRWSFLGIWTWIAARLVLYFGDIATLAQPPMPQQSVCPRKVLWNKAGKVSGEVSAGLFLTVTNKKQKYIIYLILKTTSKRNHSNLLWVYHVYFLNEHLRHFLGATLREHSTLGL